eukprot:2684893-Alexandrium_andersonii.AAC.1
MCYPDPHNNSEFTSTSRAKTQHLLNSDCQRRTCEVRACRGGRYGLLAAPTLGSCMNASSPCSCALWQSAFAACGSWPRRWADSIGACSPTAR